MSRLVIVVMVDAHWFGLFKARVGGFGGRQDRGLNTCQ
jgi:hypothetical protein